jgi:hypothetical protein
MNLHGCAHPEHPLHPEHPDHPAHACRGHVKTAFQRPDRITEPLYVCTVVFNSPRYRSRWRLYEDFARHVAAAPAAVLYTAEVAFGEREFALTECGHPRHLQLRTAHELWLKERALNLLVQRLPADWKYVLIADADVKWVRDDWADEIRHALQHYAIVQPWTHAYDLDPDHQVIAEHRSFAYSILNGAPVELPSVDSYYYGAARGGVMWFHPGYAWAYRRPAWDGIGGLLDIAILGAADAHMAHALGGAVGRTLPKALHPEYRRDITRWAQRADRHIKRNFGYVKGALLHGWHGSKAARRYATRGQILVDTQYNPRTDLVRDAQGLWQLEQASRRHWDLRDQVRRYFAERNEDASA